MSIALWSLLFPTPQVFAVLDSKPAVSVQFLKSGAFDAQNLITIPHVKLLRVLGKLSPLQLSAIEASVRTWLGLEKLEA